MSIQRATVVGGLAALAGAVAFAGCGGSDNKTSGSSSDPIKVAIVQPYTGDSAYYGEQADQAFALAMKHSGSKIGSRPIKLIKGDSKCQPAVAVQATNQLLTEKPAAVLTSACSGDTLAIKPLLSARKIPVCSINFASEITGGKDGDYMWRAEPSGAIINAQLAKHIAAEGVRRIAVIHDTSSYGQDNTKTLVKALKDNGVDVTTVASYGFTDTDYSGQILKAKKANVDAIHVEGYDLQIGHLIKQIRQLGLKLPIYATADAGNNTAKEAGGEAMEDVVFATSWLPNWIPAATKFTDAWKKEYNTTPALVMSNFYDCASVLISALKAAGPDASSDELNEALKATNLPDMPSGTVAFDQQHERANPPVMLGTYRNGKPVLTKVLSGSK